MRYVQYDSYLQISKLAFQALLTFATMYLCKSGFSVVLHMKTKERNKMNVEDDMRMALSSMQPQILQLAANLQNNHHIDSSINIRNTFLVLTLIRHLGKNINGVMVSQKNFKSGHQDKKVAKLP